LIGQPPKILAFDWLSARVCHLHFVNILKRKADFELDFELFNTRTGSFQFEEKFQQVNLNALRETANAHLF